MVSEERKALEEIKKALIRDGYDNQKGLKYTNILEGCVNASEILRIIFNAPYIIDLLFRKGELGKQASERYMWGTISDKDAEKIKEFFKDGKK